MNQAVGYRKSLIEFIREQAKPPEKFSHQARLYRLATEIAEDKPFDDDVLFAAAWLHDLGVFIGHRPEDSAALAKWDNVAYAIQEVPQILLRFGFPQQKIGGVVEAIRTHLPSSEPTSFEGILLHDADILEQLGAIAVLRTVSKIGRDTRFLVFPDALAVLKRNLEQLPAQLKLDSAKTRAHCRVTALKQFLQAAATEAKEEEL
jgi:uncharacterized protein